MKLISGYFPYNPNSSPDPSWTPTLYDWCVECMRTNWGARVKCLSQNVFLKRIAGVTFDLGYLVYIINSKEANLPIVFAMVTNSLYISMRRSQQVLRRQPCVKIDYVLLGNLHWGNTHRHNFNTYIVAFWRNRCSSKASYHLVSMETGSSCPLVIHNCTPSKSINYLQQGNTINKYHYDLKIKSIPSLFIRR
jgi:hypothetical protein